MLLHLVLDSNILNYKLAEIPFIAFVWSFEMPREIRLDCKQNHILVYAYNDLLLELPTHICRSYEYKVTNVTIWLEDIMKDLKKVMIEMFDLCMQGCNIEITLDNNGLLTLNMGDEITLELPVAYKTIDGTVTNNIVKPDYSDVYDYVNKYIGKPEKKEIKLPELKDDIQVSKDDLCKICMDKDVSTINLPCGHICFCITCSHTYIENQKDTCPMCNVKLVEIKRFYK